jgi:undecaprenyl-diphosphatase
MIFLEYLKVILIGIVEGITEWLPVSSTGHMILFERIFPLEKMSPEFYSMFLYVIQLAAIFAVICFFFYRLNPFSKRKNAAEVKNTWRTWMLVLVGIIPAGIVGVALDDLVDEYVVASAFGPFVVAATLVLYGILYVVMERMRKDKPFAVSDISVELYGIYETYEEFTKAFCDFIADKPKYVKIKPEENPGDILAECDRLNTLLVRASI